MSSSRHSGFEAEQRALTYLQAQGLRLIEKNYHFERGQHLRGEIDLIMKDKDYHVFIEVRMRRNKDYGSSLETINRKKQRLLIHTATQYLLDTQQYNQVACRFDAIGVNHNQEIIWIKNAFQV